MPKYSLIIQWSEEDQAYIAISPELNGLSAFGSTYEEAAKELSIAQELYLETMKEDGEEIPAPDIVQPFSGQVRLRLPKSLHAGLSIRAKKEGISLNTYMVQLLAEKHSLRLVKNAIESLKPQRSGVPMVVVVKGLIEAPLAWPDPATTFKQHTNLQ